MIATQVVLTMLSSAVYAFEITYKESLDCHDSININKKDYTKDLYRAITIIKVYRNMESNNGYRTTIQ